MRRCEACPCRITLVIFELDRMDGYGAVVGRLDRCIRLSEKIVIPGWIVGSAALRRSDKPSVRILADMHDRGDALLAGLGSHVMEKDKGATERCGRHGPAIGAELVDDLLIP